MKGWVLGRSLFSYSCFPITLPPTGLPRPPPSWAHLSLQLSLRLRVRGGLGPPSPSLPATLLPDGLFFIPDLIAAASPAAPWQGFPTLSPFAPPLLLFLLLLPEPPQLLLLLPAPPGLQLTAPFFITALPLADPVYLLAVAGGAGQLEKGLVLRRHCSRPTHSQAEDPTRSNPPVTA